MNRFTSSLLTLLVAALLSFAAVGCGGEAEDHAHGPDTHTHDDEAAAVADTAGTYVDTTGAFFEDEPGAAAEAPEDDHEHGEDTHTHD